VGSLLRCSEVDERCGFFPKNSERKDSERNLSVHPARRGRGPHTTFTSAPEVLSNNPSISILVLQKISGLLPFDSRQYPKPPDEQRSPFDLRSWRTMGSLDLARTSRMLRGAEKSDLAAESKPMIDSKTGQPRAVSNTERPPQTAQHNSWRKFWCKGDPRNAMETWNREELYVVVWEQPLVKVVPKCGISAVALGKVRHKLQISN
jgi:hypothetical protein